MVVLIVKINSINSAGYIVQQYLEEEFMLTDTRNSSNGVICNGSFFLGNTNEKKVPKFKIQNWMSTAIKIAKCMFPGIIIAFIEPIGKPFIIYIIIQ